MLAALLLLTQGWGMWHRVAHGPQAVGHLSAAAAESHRAGSVATGQAQQPEGVAWFGHAAGEPAGPDAALACWWFDHLACGDGPPATPAVLTTVGDQPAQPRPGRQTQPASRTLLAFHARGPPQDGAAA